LVWAPRKAGWVAEWHARTDLIKRGFLPQRARVWAGEWPSETDCALISDQCTRLQAEMLVWGRGGIPVIADAFDGTLGSLIRLYQTDKDSSYQELRYASRMNDDSRCKLIARDYGDTLLSDIDARMIKDWWRAWTSDGRTPSAHGKVGQLRTLFAFGSTLVGKRGDPECRRLREDAGLLRFKMGKPRKEYITATQALAIIAKAHELGRHSIALAQAFQFECTLRQKDVIGEWVPMGEPELSEIHDGQWKWLRGIRGEEIDANLILRHMTSKRQKPVEVDLRLAPMVMAELDLAGKFPEKGPLIICEATGVAWQAKNFREKWRKVATAAGVPNHVWNMDSRAGAITEGTDVAAMDDVRRTATHSNVSQTQAYSRDDTKAIARVMKGRAASRNKAGTDVS
jgi:hypothetical protein